MAIPRAGGANPFARSEWTLGMALRDYFDVALKEISQELLEIRTMEQEEALKHLEALKVMLALEGYNIIPMQQDPLQVPVAALQQKKKNLPVVIAYPDTPDPYVKADSDGVNYEEPLEPLPPQVGMCDNTGYSVGAVHPAS